jgi:hypothetical protein
METDGICYFIGGVCGVFSLRLLCLHLLWTRQFGTVFPRRITIYNMGEGESASRLSFCCTLFLFFCLPVCVGDSKPHSFTAKS